MDTTSLELRTQGTIEIKERDAEPDQYGGYPNTTLLKRSVDAMYCRFGIGIDDEETNQFSIGLSDYHITDEYTEKVYHTDVAAFLTWGEVRKLHAYLEFILKFAPAEDAVPPLLATTIDPEVLRILVGRKEAADKPIAEEAGKPIDQGGTGQ